MSNIPGLAHHTIVCTSHLQLPHAVNTSPVIGNFVCYRIDSLKIMYIQLHVNIKHIGTAPRS